MELPTFSDIEAAAERLKGKAVETPLLNSAALDREVGAQVFIKPEVLQRTVSDHSVSASSATAPTRRS